MLMSSPPRFLSRAVLWHWEGMEEGEKATGGALSREGGVKGSRMRRTDWKCQSPLKAGQYPGWGFHQPRDVVGGWMLPSCPLGQREQALLEELGLCECWAHREQVAGKDRRAIKYCQCQRWPGLRHSFWPRQSKGWDLGLSGQAPWKICRAKTPGPVGPGHRVQP